MALINFVLQLTAFVLCYSCSQATDDRCIKVPIIKDFNLRKLMGNWHGQEVGDEDEATLKCASYTMKPSNDKTGTGFTVQRFNNRQKSNGTVDVIKVNQVGNTSEYNFVWRGYTRSGWIVGTNYNSWASWYLCVPEQNDKGMLMIATRDKTPSNTTMEEARNFVRNIGFRTDKSYLKPMDQSKCN